MEAKSSERASLKFIILYKGIIATIMLIISLIYGWSWRNYDALTTWAELNLINGEFHTIELILKPILNSNIPGLKLVARSTAIYGSLIIVALIGLWYEKVWSKILFVGLVAIPLPIELKELVHHFSMTRLAVFLLNLVVFIFLIMRELRSRN